MKPSLFVFGLIISAQISVIKGACSFKHGNEPYKNFRYNCECGPDKKPFFAIKLKHMLLFSNPNRKYCCVPSKSTCNVSKTNKWCKDGQLLPLYQPCNGSCPWSQQEKCPQINGASFTTEQCYIKGYLGADKYQCLNRKNIAEEVIANKAVVEVTSKISKRFNLLEYLESYNETFIKCKSQNNQILEKVCGLEEFWRTKRNDAILCKRNHSNVVVQLTKGDICRDVQFLETMNYTKRNITYVKRVIYDTYSGKISL